MGTYCVGKLNIKGYCWLALALLPIHFYFETGCSVYNLNELQAESFKLLFFCSELNKVTKHK